LFKGSSGEYRFGWVQSTDEGRAVMKDNQSPNGVDVMLQAFGVLAPWRSALGENWVSYWRSQDKILDSMQEFTREWFERRHEATKTALEAAQRSSEANSPAEVVRELQAWMLGSMQRVVADGLACQKHLMAMAELSAPPTANGDTREIKASAPGNMRKGTAEHAKAA
jgi:hypothetical protein